MSAGRLQVMTTAAQPFMARWRVLLLAALTALAALLFGAGTASASGLPAAQTRVGVSHPTVVHVVGVAEHITAGQHWVRGPSQLQIVSGHCVAAEGEGGLTSAARTCSVNSFTGATLILMADGTKKPIRDVKVGDKVLATDPETGQTAARPVTKLIVHGGKHTMVDVRLADGTTITATDRHPFWDASTGEFTYAIDLRSGDLVRELDGTLLAVARTRVYDQELTAYNLTVDGIHTYYAGTTPVLVHNSCGPESLFEVKTRANPGSDGGISHHLIEKVEGQTVSITHQVEVKGEIVHQHQRYVGLTGEQRYFPSEWSQFPDINFGGGW